VRPIKARFRDLDAMARHYIDKHRDEAAEELGRFRDQPNLRECIRQAGLARRWDDDSKRWKRLDHQRRIPADVLRAWANVLLRKKAAMHSCQTFEALFDVVKKESLKFWRNGELTVYDTALRIGAHLKLEPEEIYLHAGTRAGARALGIDGKRRSVRRQELPSGLRRLKPREIEDCLCMYKNDLKRMRRALSIIPGC
jgi:hypothetical protein